MPLIERAVKRSDFSPGEKSDMVIILLAGHGAQRHFIIK
jgi:hypothetical protein